MTSLITRCGKGLSTVSITLRTSYLGDLMWYVTDYCGVEYDWCGKRLTRVVILENLVKDFVEGVVKPIRERGKKDD